MTSSLVNHQFRLAARPVGLPKRSDWKQTEEPVPQPGEGEMLVKVLYISVDPAMRGWMNEGRSYIEPVDRVIESRNPAFAVGDHVYAPFGVQEYAISNGQGVTEVDPEVAPLSAVPRNARVTGVTAYVGLLDICHPKSRETVVVSGAARAAGMLMRSARFLRHLPTSARRPACARTYQSRAAHADLGGIDVAAHHFSEATEFNEAIERERVAGGLYLPSGSGPVPSENGVFPIDLLFAPINPCRYLAFTVHVLKVSCTTHISALARCLLESSQQH